MSVLEIIFTSLLGAILIVCVGVILVTRGLRINKTHTYRVVNKYAKKKQIVFFGDSLTDFYPLQEFVDSPTIYNRGIASDTTQHLLHRIDNVTDIDPAKLFLLIGTNDLGIGHRPEWVCGQIEKICDIILEKCPHCKIHILTQYPIRRNRNFYSFFACAMRSTKKLQLLTKLVGDMAQRRNFCYIDVTKVLVDEHGWYKKELTIDGLHTTIEGYCLVTDVLAPYILGENESENAPTVNT